MQELKRNAATKRKTPPWTASPLFPTLLIIGGAFLLGVCWSAGINRVDIGKILFHFEAVWSLPSNRPQLFKLIFTLLFTGLVFAALASAFVYWWKWVNPPKAEPAGQEASPAESLSLPPEDRTEMTTHTTREDEGEVPTPTAIASPETPTPPFTDTVLLPPQQSVAQDVHPPERRTTRVAVPNPFPSVHDEAPPTYIEITLLGKLSLSLIVPGTDRRIPVEIEDLNAKHQQLMALLQIISGEGHK